MICDTDEKTLQQRIDRIDRTISEQKLYIITTDLNRKFQAAHNLQTLESMRILLGISAEAAKGDTPKFELITAVGLDGGRTMSDNNQIIPIGAPAISRVKAPNYDTEGYNRLLKIARRGMERPGCLTSEEMDEIYTAVVAHYLQISLRKSDMGGTPITSR